MPIYLIRHGETDSNRERVVQTPDTPLSTLGHLQAKLLAQRFSSVTKAKILCSDYLRTKQTATALMTTLNCPISYHEELRERNFGDLGGRAYSDIDDEFFAEHYQPPNGEGTGQFSHRISQAWQSILETYRMEPCDLMVVTHGLVLRVILQHNLKLAPSLMEKNGVHNTCVTTLKVGEDVQVLSLCDISHLDDLYTNGAAV